VSNEHPSGIGEHRLPARHMLRGLQILGALLAIGGGVLGRHAYEVDRLEFLRAYLVVYLFYLGFALGSLGILGLQYVTGGRWGVVLRRPLEAAASTMPLMAILFFPIAFGVHDLYEWTHADIVAKDALLAQKAGYLNEPFFLARAVAYFLVWIPLAFFLCQLSRRQDTEPGASLDRKLEYLGRGTLVVYALTMTFAAVDWAMSVDPRWFSHIYGVRMIGGQILTAFAFTVAVTVALSRHEPLSRLITPARFHDLGNLMLAFVMLWAYFELSQFLIIWSGNLPEEVTFYVTRSGGEWKLFSLLLVVLQFVVPFLVLLSRPVKRNPGTLALVALLVLAMRLADIYWQIVPSFQAAVTPQWVFPVLLVGMGGLWLTIYVWQLAAFPLLPTSDTSLLAED